MTGNVPILVRRSDVLFAAVFKPNGVTARFRTAINRATQRGVRPMTRRVASTASSDRPLTVTQ